MRFAEFEAEAKALVADACGKLGYGGFEIAVGPPPNPSYGDISCAVPLKIGKQLGAKPGDVALRLADKVMAAVGRTRYVGSVSPHPSGYLNFALNHSRFVKDSIEEGLGQPESWTNQHAGRKVVIEHTAVNPNKALHVGHARNLVIGDSLVRIMASLGNDVQALNYIDDSGAQVADIIVGFRFLGLSDQPPTGSKFDVYCGDKVYTRVNDEYTKDPDLRQKQSFILQEIEKGEGEVAEYTRSVISRVLADQLLTCWRLGARYDLLNWESQILHSGMWSGVFETLKENGTVRYVTEGDNKNCWIINDPDTGEEKVVVRSDGTLVYVAKDIPYAAWKIGMAKDPFGYEDYHVSQPGDRRLYSTNLGGKNLGLHFGGADLAITVIDTKQSYLQRIVGKVLERIKEGSGARYVHRSYEVVAISKKTATQLGFTVDGEFAHMSGRKGLYVNVDAMLEELKKKARGETRKRNLSESESWVDDVAEAIAVAALRYELLKQDPDKMIVFDIEESLRFEGDTGPYLIYTYARARRILDKTTGKPAVTSDSAAKLTRKEEHELAKRMSTLDKAVITAAQYYSPKEVVRYAHDLAVVFNEFYENVPVNKEEDEALRDARLALVDAASRILAESMRLIGIPYRDRI